MGFGFCGLGRGGLGAERAAFQATHAEVGAYLLDLWGLPLPLVEAVALHHEPARASEPVFSPLTAVHIANVLEQEVSSVDAPGGLDSNYLDRLNLSGRRELSREQLRLLG